MKLGGSLTRQDERDMQYDEVGFPLFWPHAKNHCSRVFMHPSFCICSTDRQHERRSLYSHRSKKRLLTTEHHLDTGCAPTHCEHRLDDRRDGEQNAQHFERDLLWKDKGMVYTFNEFFLTLISVLGVVAV